MTNQLTTITTAQMNILTQSTPREAIKQRKGRGNTMLSYVSHDWVTRQLNEAFGWSWSFTISDEMIIPSPADPQEVIVKGCLTVHTPNGDLIKNQFGASDVKRNRNGNLISLGDDLKAAGSDALKKCASLLGVALDLYGDQSPNGGVVVSSPPQPESKLIAAYNRRIRKLVGEIKAIDAGFVWDFGKLNGANEDQLVNYGKTLRQQLDALRGEAVAV